MNIIQTEPCCYPKHLRQIFAQLDNKSAGANHVLFQMNGDWTLVQLLGWIKNLCPGGNLTICLPDVEAPTINMFISMLDNMVPLVGRQSCHHIERINLVVCCESANRSLLMKMHERYGERFTVGTSFLDNYSALLIEGVSPLIEEGYRRFLIMGGLPQHIDAPKYRILSLTDSEEEYNVVKHFLEYQIKRHPLCDEK